MADKVFFGLLVIAFATVVSGSGVWCTQNSGLPSYRNKPLYCKDDCCGDYDDRQCCVIESDPSFSYIGLILGYVFGWIALIAILSIIVCVCCCRRKLARQGQVVGTTSTFVTTTSAGAPMYTQMTYPQTGYPDGYPQPYAGPYPAQPPAGPYPAQSPTGTSPAQPPTGTYPAQPPTEDQQYAQQFA